MLVDSAGRKFFTRNKTITFVFCPRAIRVPRRSIRDKSSNIGCRERGDRSFGDATPGYGRAIHFNPVCQHVRPTPLATSHHLISHRERTIFLLRTVFCLMAAATSSVLRLHNHLFVYLVTGIWIEIYGVAIQCYGATDFQNKENIYHHYLCIGKLFKAESPHVFRKLVLFYNSGKIRANLNLQAI